MAQRRKIEVFTAGCRCCIEAMELVEFLAGTEHDIEIRDRHDRDVAAAPVVTASAACRPSLSTANSSTTLPGSAPTKRP